jgi:hypothetical protein
MDVRFEWLIDGVIPEIHRDNFSIIIFFNGSIESDGFDRLPLCRRRRRGLMRRGGSKAPTALTIVAQGRDVSLVRLN